MLYIINLYLLTHTLNKLIPDLFNGTVTSSMKGCCYFLPRKYWCTNADFISKWTSKDSRHKQFEQQMLNNKTIDSKYYEFFLYIQTWNSDFTNFQNKDVFCTFDKVMTSLTQGCGIPKKQIHGSNIPLYCLYSAFIPSMSYK